MSAKTSATRSRIRPPRRLHCWGPGRILIGGIDAMDDTARCPRCDTTKPVTEFPLDRSRKSGRYSYCKACNRANAKNHIDRRRATPEGREAMRRYSWLAVLKTYGVTEEDYNRLFVEQDGLCAICRLPESFKNKDGLRPLTFDHDHATGMARSLLCHHCNCVLGLARENPQTLESAAAYLRRWV